jgi:hypothetical protein
MTGEAEVDVRDQMRQTNIELCFALETCHLVEINVRYRFFKRKKKSRIYLIIAKMKRL